MFFRVALLAGVASVFSVVSASASFMTVTGTAGNDFLDFEGESAAVNETLVNPYSGYSVSVNGSYNVNTGDYDGLEGFDRLTLTDSADYLAIRDGATRLVDNIELFVAGNGDDFIGLADSEFILGDVIVNGGGGNDIIWTNAGDDYVIAGGGNDSVDMGAGKDFVRGGDGDETISIGGDYAGKFIDGENDVDTILTTLIFEDFTFEAFSFDVDGAFGDNFNSAISDVFTGTVDGLLITHIAGGDFLFVRQTEFMRFGNGALLDLATLELTSEVPLPAAFPLFLAGVSGLGWLQRRKRRNA